MFSEKRKIAKILILLLSLSLLFYLLHDTPALPPRPRDKTYILVMVLSTPANRRNRDILRRNSYLGYPWLYNGTHVDFKHVFVLGDSGDSDVNNDVITEAEELGDIAIGDFHDAYETLSEKVIWGFEHVLAHYDFTFCIKVDEDSFINMDYLARHLSRVTPDMMPDYYAGKPRQGSLAVPQNGKFKVDKWEEGQITEYVQYNLGGGYILTTQSMKKVLMVHYSGAVEPILWEDVYVGMLAYLIGMPPLRIYHYYVSKFYPFCTDDKTILLHHTKPELQARMLHHFNLHGIYCPKEKTVEQVLNLINSYEIIDWLDEN